VLQIVSVRRYRLSTFLPPHPPLISNYHHNLIPLSDHALRSFSRILPHPTKKRNDDDNDNNHHNACLLEGILEGQARMAILAGALPLLRGQCPQPPLLRPRTRGEFACGDDSSSP